MPVRVLNILPDEVEIQRGTALGISEPITLVHNYKFAPKETEERCSCECKCDYQWEYYKPPYTRPCCHQLEWMDSEDKYKYLWLNEYKESPVVCNQFERDPEVPPHVKDLYTQCLPALTKTQHRNRLAQMLSEYADVFAKHPDDIGRTNLVKHVIDTGDAKPVHQRCRRLAKAHIDVIREQVQKLSKAGIIRPSDSNWAANCVVVSKKDG